MTKAKVLDAIKELPQEFDLDELIELLIFIDKVEKGFQQLDKGEIKSHEEAKSIIKAWQK